jgi:hypothetical protein
MVGFTQLLGVGRVPTAAGGGGISFVDDSTEAFAAGSGTKTHNLASYQQNDVVYVQLTSDTGTPTIVSAGWTEVYAPASQGSPSCKIWRKVMGASPDTTFQFTGNTGAPTTVVAQGFRGMDTTTPEDGVTVVRATGASGLPNSGSITPATTGAWVLSAGALDDDNGTGITAPTDYSNLSWIAAGGAAGTTSTGMMASRSGMTASTPENPAAFTGTGTDAWVAATISLRPAS